MAASALAACSSSGDSADGIGYVVDGAVPTYNVSSTGGAHSAARQAFVRVQTGFSYPGPDGETVLDTDFGTVLPVQSDPAGIEYEINPAAHYSDGKPVVCDDMVLAWAAQSGRFASQGPDGEDEPLFDAPVDPLMAQIESIDCDPGSRTATVHYGGDRAPVDWKAAFGATSMLPAHVVSNGVGGAEIVDAVDEGDIDALTAIADYWNSAFALNPGSVDPDVFVSSGPYRLDEVEDDGSVVLVANDQWWGDPARTETIVVHPRSVSVDRLSSEGKVDVVDTGAGAVAGLNLGDGFDTQVHAVADVEQLIFSGRGDLADPAARRAVALCVPRARIAEMAGSGHDGGGESGDSSSDGGSSGDGGSDGDGDGALIQDSRTTLPGVVDHAFVASTVGGDYTDPDIDAAKGALADAGLDGPTVRIGYHAPDARRTQVVRAMTQACAPAGIDIVDAGSADFTPSALRDGTVDAVLGGTGGAQHGPPRGASTPITRLGALASGASGNIGGYSNGRIDAIVAQLRVTPPGTTEAINLAHEAEDILWNEMPTLPLYVSARDTSFASSLHAVDPTASWAGAGWNMDRWMVLK